MYLGLSEKICRVKRYIKYGIQYFFYEKPRGLDFTMRDMHLLEETNGTLHGYSKTNEKHLRKIFNYLNVSESDSLLDIGCGKGVVLKEAAKYPFVKIAGIDIDGNLIKIAKRNFEVLKMQDRVTCMEADALKFQEYGNYNVFFFFNPFGEEIFGEVINKIIEESYKKKKIYIVYHNPRYASEIEKSNKFLKVEEMYDPSKRYMTNIYVSQW